MKLESQPNNTAITSSLLKQLNTGLYRYLVTNSKALDDNKHYKSRTTLDTINTENLCEGGPAISISENKMPLHQYTCI